MNTLKTISVGKYRGLTQVSTQKSIFSILALDHRNNLRNAINPYNPTKVCDEDLSAFKSEVVSRVSPYASSVLLDPEVGAFQCIANGSLSGEKGLICALEKTGYTGDPISRISKILPEWSVSKAKRMGASAIKLLVYYHPGSEHANQIEEVIIGVGEECEKDEIPFFLEPLSYSLVEGEKLTPGERRDVVIETAFRLTGLGPDILKAEFPVEVNRVPDEGEWHSACSELTQAAKIPWVLLSASVEFEQYLRQVQVACDVGCSGVAAGRAVWKEAIGTSNSEREVFLSEIAAVRMHTLTETCDIRGTSWRKYYCSQQINSGFYQEY